MVKTCGDSLTSATAVATPITILPIADITVSIAPPMAEKIEP
jgi:hypothetical protein